MSWVRTTNKQPCPICEKPGWCSVSEDGAVAICMRVESGKKTRNNGNLHWLKSSAKIPAIHRSRTFTLERNASVSDWSERMGEYANALPDRRLRWLADKLGLAPDALRLFGPGWSARHESFAFPMSDQNGKVIGIHLRKPNGRKWAVKGSRNGLFLPSTLPPTISTLYLAEGLTDSVALSQLGLLAIGRQSCTGGNRMIKGLLRKHSVEEVIVLADNDGPGHTGAQGLIASILCFVAKVKMISPPDGIKDARAWVQTGVTTEQIEQIMAQTKAQHVSISRKAVEDD